MPLSFKLQSLGTADHRRRLLRFGLVGASGVLVNSALLYLLTQAGGLNHLVAAALATEVTIFYNFSLNDRWAFRDAKPRISWARRALRYNFVALGGLVISVAALAMLTYFLDLNYLIANLLAIGAATLWNYAVNSCFTWSTIPLNSISDKLLAIPSSAEGLKSRRACHRARKSRSEKVPSKRASLHSVTEATRKKAFPKRFMPYPALSQARSRRSYRGTDLVAGGRSPGPRF
jgi:putative flippase GtrA